MKKIPDAPWTSRTSICFTFERKAFEEWWKENIEPLNKMLDEAIEVGRKRGCTWQTAAQFSEREKATWDERAFLINIEPIKQDTAEDILRDYIRMYEGATIIEPNYNTEILARAKKLLSEENKKLARKIKGEL